MPNIADVPNREARHVRLGGPDERAVVYASDPAHSSGTRGLVLLGFGPDRRHVPG